MPDFDHAAGLWPATEERFFQDLILQHREQIGGTCVSTGLSLLTGEARTILRAHINTQDPVSWSHYLSRHGMKLSYCPTDLRRFKYYMPELLAIDDLFAIGIYSPEVVQAIGRDPDASGWICGSHFILLHRDTVYDTALEGAVKAASYHRLDSYVKRIFRVLPSNHPRGL